MNINYTPKVLLKKQCFFNNIPDKINTINRIKTNKIISLDPGLRTFMTGISETKTINIETGINTNICKYLERLKKIKDNMQIKKSIKKKNEIIINRKIHNKIDDMQWKTIKYLTSNYDYILIGDMSAKGIISNENSILSANQKTACMRTRYYEFRSRLEYKCKINGNGYMLVNEAYTSKTCSICGTIKKNLGYNKIFNCGACGGQIDRDINGAKNIYIKTQEKR